MDATKTNRATESALSTLELLCADLAAVDFCRGECEGRDLSRDAKAALREHGYDGTNGEAVAESIEDTLRGRPLSVCYRAAAFVSVGEPLEPDSFELLLGTGGPAVRIVGSLDRGQPISATLEAQDWFTPWVEVEAPDIEAEAALLAFASLFYYGEG